MRRRTLVLVTMVLALGVTAATAVHPPQATAAETKPGAADIDVLTVRGTIAAIDKDQHTVTLKGPLGGTLTLEVQDPKKLDAIQVGDPVIATYYESVAVQVKKAGTATPGVSASESVAASPPGETPSGVIRRRLTVTATITGVDTATGHVTFKGPHGDVETVKVKDPKMVEGVSVGDHVVMSYTEALAIALDKP